MQSLGEGGVLKMIFTGSNFSSSKGSGQNESRNLIQSELDLIQEQSLRIMLNQKVKILKS